MARPRVSRSFLSDREAPLCPHCGSGMEEATITLEELVGHWPLPAYVAVREDGYAPSTAGLTVTCRHCTRPSVLVIDEPAVKLVGARTAADERMLSGWSP